MERIWVLGDMAELLDQASPEASTLLAFELCEPGKYLCSLSQLSVPVTQRTVLLSLKVASMTDLSVFPPYLLTLCFAQTRGTHAFAK